MTTKQTKERRGGRRENAGRRTDYEQRCTVYAIQLGLVCSESTARRTLSDYGDSAAQVIGSTREFKILQEWDEMSEFTRGMVYGILKTRVEQMLDEGWGRRL